MAATDAFDTFCRALDPRDREAVREYISDQRAHLMAARSEDARVRLVEEFISDIHDRLAASRRG